MSKRVQTFAERLKIGMNEKGIRAVDLSEKSNVSESLISCYRSGRYEATQVNLQMLAEALDVSIAWLMGYDVPIGHYDAPPILARTQAERVKSKIDQLTKNQLDLIESLVNQFLS